MTDAPGISHERAQVAAQRLINAAFKTPHAPWHKFSIPVDPDKDDDLVIMAYIKQQEAK